MKTSIEFKQDNAHLNYFPDFLTRPIADELFSQLLNQTDWQQSSIHLFGRQVQEPRLTIWYADAGVRYAYSGRQLCANPWPAGLLELRNQLSAVTNSNFNAMLGNYYRNGSDYMGWHSDDEASLGSQPVIASLSLGAERCFMLRRKDDHHCKHRLPLQHGSLLIMRGATQRYWQHALPRRKRVSQARINLTFRQVF